MRIRISHDTTYRYSEPARSLIQALRMTPRDHEGQRVQSWRIEPSVDGRFRQSQDHLGNIVHVFSADAATKSIVVRVTGEVDTSDADGMVRGTVERAPDPYYLRDTGLTLADPDLRTFARRVAGAPGGTLATLHRLVGEIYEQISFDVRHTYVATTAREAFAMRRGVCQDMSHIFIACARSIGLPARYVSGYFLRGDGVVDQEAAHAWAEVKIPDLGWVGFDPANGISTTASHVRVAIGLDYYGAAPVRGSRMGGGAEQLEVALRIEAAQRQMQS